ncbi:signal peptidase I [Candidatus Woesebacteria bacterium]|nr:signal peptidase I [Candidatus Woesebacteria bacterium]
MIQKLRFFFKAAILTLFIFCICIGCYFGLYLFGVLKEQVPVSGASMLPTLPEKGTVPFQKYAFFPLIEHYFKPKLHKGDIVVFDNNKTEQILKEQNKQANGFVKRIVGMPGDTVEIKDGFVYVNNTIIDEPYTLKARSTFGGDEIKDCQKTTIPEDHYFVLGDNRKVSMDSRQIGIISIQNISHYIPFDKQEGIFSKHWRDTINDSATQNKTLFDTAKYLKLLNTEREKYNLPPLEYQLKLEQSARLRAENMLQYDDFDPKAPKSGYTMERALQDVGYTNIVLGEFPIVGYYDEQELFDAFFEQQNTSDFLLNKNYQEVGVSSFVATLNSCPVQVVVQHLAGYVPPNYSTEQIASWNGAKENLIQVQKGWIDLKQNNAFYEQNKKDIDRINEIISLRIYRITTITDTLIKNEWLTEEEKNWTEEDKDLSNEQNQIADLLNERIRSFKQ